MPATSSPEKASQGSASAEGAGDVAAQEIKEAAASNGIPGAAAAIAEAATEAFHDFDEDSEEAAAGEGKPADAAAPAEARPETPVSPAPRASWGQWAASFVYAAPASEDEVDPFQKILQDLAALEPLPAYRSIGGEMPAKDSPLFSEASLRRYLKRFGPAEAAQAVLATLKWRLLTVPLQIPEGCRAQALVEEEPRRFLNLGPNRDGDLVVALDYIWGQFASKGATLLQVVRMLLLAIEPVFAEADAIGHPQLVFINYRGPPPSNFAMFIVHHLEKYFPDRAKKLIVYPFHRLWARVAHTSMWFLSEQTRSLITITTDEKELVEAARLVGPEQIPESWRGGFHAVMERDKPDGRLVNMIAREYLSPWADDGSWLTKAAEGPWLPGDQEAAVVPHVDVHFGPRILPATHGGGAGGLSAARSGSARGLSAWTGLWSGWSSATAQPDLISGSVG